MKKLILTLFLITLFSCSTDSVEEIIVEEPILNTAEIKLDGLVTTDIIVNVSAFYSCNERVSVSVRSKKNNVTSALFDLTLLKNGELIYASFSDKRGHFSKEYRTSDFIPSSTFTIDEFEFVENEKLNIKFSGQLLKQVFNYLETSETLNISGEIKVTSFGISICNIFNDFIELNNELNFFRINRLSQGFGANLVARYDSTSLDGYNIQFVNFNTFLKDMPLGTYNFDQLSTSERINFQQYIGPPIFFYSHIFIPIYWKKFETAGSFTIVEKTVINGHNVTKVVFNFTASYDGVVEYNFTDAEFATIW
jgi:hypothetical protein